MTFFQVNVFWQVAKTCILLHQQRNVVSVSTLSSPAGPVTQRPISANPELNTNLGVFSFF